MLTADLAHFVATTPSRDLNEGQLAAARAAFIDTLGVMILGSVEEPALIAQRWAADMEAKPRATIVGSQIRGAPTEVAFANGVAAHVHDFDDSLRTLRGHPSAVIVPALLAVGEDTGASGIDLLAGYAVALEVAGKLGRAIGHGHYLRGWHSTATIGTFSATAAACRLYGLDAVGIARAWGLAAASSAGMVRNFGTMAKCFQTGHAARAGVTAAQLARSGMTSDEAIFDDGNSFIELYGSDDAPKLADLLQKLGTPWEIDDPGIFVKKWPCCYCNHRPVGGLLELIAEHDLRPDDIEEIAVGFPPGADRALIKSDPKSGLEGKFSIEYAMAATLLDRGLGIDSFTDEAVMRPEIRKIMSRVHRYSVAAEGHYSGIEGFTDLRVRTANDTYEMRIDRVPGSPAWPLSPEGRHAKFIDCASRVIGMEAAEEIYSAISGIAEISDISTLMKQLLRSSGVASERRAQAG